MFDDVLEAEPDPAFVLDPVEDRFVGANASGSAMLGYSRAELLETPISRIHPGELPQLQDFVGRVLRDGHGTTITLTCRTRAGGYLPTEMALHAFEHGGRVYVLALIHDRSEHRGGERPLRSGSVASGTLGDMVTTGLIVRLEARAGKEAELAAFLESALPLVRDEPATIAWFALRTDSSSFAIVDAFPDEQGRQAHLNGAVAAALLARAEELLAKPPEILPADVLAAKLP
jgi:PAS domain S-box-containing protein